MNNKFFAVSVDALLKTFSVVDAGEAVSFHIEPDDGPSMSANDYIIGFVGQGIDQFRMAFVVTNVEGDSLSLSKIIEREDGVSVSDFADAINGQLGSLSAPGCIIELPDLVGKEILNKLQGKVGSQEKKTFVMSSILQLITYGAPGTGKSHQIDECTNENNSIRVTFHPDTDYAAFVGAYKPTMVGTRKQVILDYENLVDKFKEYLSVQPTNVTRACALFGYDYHDSITDMINGGYTIPKLVDDAYKSGSSYDSVVRAGMSVYEQSPSETESISYSFVPQAFMKAYVEAWRRYANADLQGDAKIYYLVIEEINRGNCAQIFGDLFQLLDRADNGFSAYAITPDDDIQKFLEKDNKYKLADISLSEDIKKETETGEKVIATAADIKTGKKLVLPPNLYIRATMNTSDQSLFPMDSAFKRRWDWEYVPITEGKDKDGKSLGWKIAFNVKKKVEGNPDTTVLFEYDWWEFVKRINEVIGDTTHSEDKKLGYFFVKAKDTVIDEKMFVNKVAFYLWNDVFKDCELDGDAFKIERESGKVDVLAFQDFFKEDGTIKEDVLKNFLTTLVSQPEPGNGAAPQAGIGA